MNNKPLYNKEDLDSATGKDKLPYECVICGDIFYVYKKYIVSKSRSTKNSFCCCSNKCRYYIRIKRTLVSCLSCGKKFYKKNIELKKTPNSFCSQSCSAKYNNNKFPKRKKQYGKCNRCKTLIPTKHKYCVPCRKLKPWIKEALVSKNESVKREGRKKKRMAVNFMGGSCIICKYDKCMGALHFHHVNPDEKEFQISGRNMSWQRMKKELLKCVLICANCHSEVHEGISKIPDNWRNIFKNKEDSE